MTGAGGQRHRQRDRAGPGPGGGSRGRCRRRQPRGQGGGRYHRGAWSPEPGARHGRGRCGRHRPDGEPGDGDVRPHRHPRAAAAGVEATADSTRSPPCPRGACIPERPSIESSDRSGVHHYKEHANQIHDRGGRPAGHRGWMTSLRRRSRRPSRCRSSIVILPPRPVVPPTTEPEVAHGQPQRARTQQRLHRCERRVDGYLSTTLPGDTPMSVGQ